MAVYGSLREGAYNYDRFVQYYGKEAFKKRSTEVIKGFDLYSLGPYPGIKQGEGPLTVDVFDCNEKVAEQIRRMEEGANYSALEVETSQGPATIWLYNGKVSEQNQVENGDWISWLQKKGA